MLQSGGVRTAALTIVLLTLFWFYGRANFYRDPGSIFFDQDRVLERSYSLHREAEAVAYRNSVFFDQSTRHPSTAIPIWKAGKAPTISLASALAGLTQVEREDLDFRVYFANPTPSDHPLWESWILDLADKAVQANGTASEAQMLELEKLDADKDFTHKAALDFSYALEDCYQSSESPYIALFEGDILLADGWFARVRKGLEDIHKGGDSHPWLDMRLFNEERSIGWASNDLFGNNVPVIAAAVASVLVLGTLLIRRCSRLPTPANSTIFVICCITVPIALVLFFQAGKSSMLPPSPGVSRQNWGCCTQGLVIPRGQVMGLVDEFRAKAGTESADIIVINYANDKDLRRYVLNPVQVQHLGFESLLSPDRPRHEAVWSMAFEDLVPEQLKKDHASMVKNIYGVEGTETVE